MAYLLNVHQKSFSYAAVLCSSFSVMYAICSKHIHYRSQKEMDMDWVHHGNRHKFLLKVHFNLVCASTGSMGMFS
ncbi:hypothetical protein DAI22_09g028332 [Oryza sativa Japonica Group]|nr:hypothetical protein DAI22_09g028332 [Oryza sativa Japonica Group]